MFFLFRSEFLEKRNADYVIDNQRFVGEPLARLELATYALRSLALWLKYSADY